MFRPDRKPSTTSTLDLATVRDTLSYMHGDIKRVPELAKAAEALDTAIKEIDAMRGRTAPPILDRLRGARFFKWKH